MVNPITYGYTASYNGVSIENASIDMSVDFDYGTAGNVLMTMTETIKIKGVVRNENKFVHSRNELLINSVRNKLTVPGKELRFAMGATVFTRNSSDDATNGPRPKLTEELQIGNEFIRVNMVIMIERQANRFSGFDGIMEIDVNYNHEIGENGLSVWTTSGTMTSRYGVCVDAFRNRLVDDYIGDPTGDFIRGQQTFNITNNKTKMTFSVADNESFYSPAVADVKNAFFKISSQVTPRSVIKTLSLTIQPTKTAGAIRKAKLFAKSVSREALLQGVPPGVTKIFKDGSGELDSRTGEITFSASVEFIVNISPTRFSMNQVTEYIFFGITTQQALSKFRSGRRDALPRGFSNRSACATFRPRLTVRTTNQATPVVDYRPELEESETVEDTGLQKYEDKAGTVDNVQVKQPKETINDGYFFIFAYSTDLATGTVFSTALKNIRGIFKTLVTTNNALWIFDDKGTGLSTELLNKGSQIKFIFKFSAETRGAGTAQDIQGEITRVNNLIKSQLESLANATEITGTG
jgi:hypothetical protein